jgi:hypothetical protein
MSVFVWLLIYGVPLAILGFVVSMVLKGYEKDRRRISSWLAITFTGLSALGGVWGFIILDQLSKRSSFDYGYEGSLLSTRIDRLPISVSVGNTFEKDAFLIGARSVTLDQRHLDDGSRNAVIQLVRCSIIRIRSRCF